MESKREIFRRQAIEYIYEYSEGESYTQEAGGVYNKTRLMALARYYKRVCINDPDLMKLLNAVQEYARIEAESPSAYDSESLHLDDILRYAEAAVKSTEREMRFAVKELALYKKAAPKLRPEDRKKGDAEALLKYSRAENGKVAALAMKYYFDDIVFGRMSATECPEELFHDYDPQESSFRYPVFTHAPIGVDISDDIRSESPFFVGLSNFAKKEMFNLISMFCDCGEGLVMIRLHDPETLEPVYVGVEKDDVYFDWIIVGHNTALWPGLLCRGLEMSGYNVAGDDPRLLMRVVSGKQDAVSEDDFRRFIPGTAEKTIDTSAYDSYFRCLDAISIALLGTMNVNVEDVQAFVELFDAVKTVIGSIFENFSDNLELIRPAMEFMVQKANVYRNSDDPSKRRSRRLELCDSIDQLFEIYSDPDLRFAPTRIFRSPLGRPLK